jgi:hypothetical protein
MKRNPARPGRLRPSRDGDLLQYEIFTTIFNEVVSDRQHPGKA